MGMVIVPPLLKAHGGEWGWWLLVWLGQPACSPVAGLVVGENEPWGGIHLQPVALAPRNLAARLRARLGQPVWVAAAH